MDAPLAIKKFGLIVERYDCTVPNIRMQIKTPAAVAPKSDEVIRRYIVSGKGERYNETLAVERVKELASVGMVVGAPN